MLLKVLVGVVQPLLQQNAIILHSRSHSKIIILLLVQVIMQDLVQIILHLVLMEVLKEYTILQTIEELYMSNEI